MKLDLNELKKHFDRVALKHINKNPDIHPMGRCTIAVISEGDERYVGISKCSESDQFSRKTGRIKALGRALTAKNRAIEDETDFSFTFDVGAIADDVKSLVPEHLYISKFDREQKWKIA